MNRSRRPVRALWTLTGVLTLPAAVTGLLIPEIYRGVVAAELLPGAASQDLMSAVAGVALPVLAFADRRGSSKVELALGLLLLLGGSRATIGWAGVPASQRGLMLFGWAYWLRSVPALACLVPSAIAHWRGQQTREGSRIR